VGVKPVVLGDRVQGAMQLTRAEVEAVVDYIYAHCRAHPESRAYRVWQRMMEFLNDTQGDLFEI